MALQAGSVGGFGSLADIQNEVERNGGVLTVSMQELRDAFGAGRLGRHVVTGISEELLKLGLGHFPQKLPASQDAEVRIYKQGGTIARIIDAVLRPSSSSDDVLRDVGGGGAALKLRRIREIVCE